VPSDRAAALTSSAPVEHDCRAGDDEGQYEVLGTESPFALIGNSQQGGDEKSCQQQRQGLRRSCAPPAQQQRLHSTLARPLPPNAAFLAASNERDT
jgi:hypothetical protein